MFLFPPPVPPIEIPSVEELPCNHKPAVLYAVPPTTPLILPPKLPTPVVVISPAFIELDKYKFLGLFAPEAPIS